MSPIEHTALTGASTGRVAVFAIGPAAVAIAELMAKHEPFDFEITAIGVGDDVGERVVAGMRSLAEAAVPNPTSILVIGDTAHAALTTDAVQALAGDRGSNTRLRIWPVFVAGDPAKLTEFDATLDELPDANCDAVLMLTQVPTPEQAARALLAWLMVKLPAPASVLGQMPDAAGRICRYVALGSELLAAPPNAAASPDETAGEAANEVTGAAADFELDSTALARRLQAAVSELPAFVALREHRTALTEAVRAADLTAVIETHQQLTAAVGLEVQTQLEALATELVATIGNAAAPEDEAATSDPEHSGPASSAAATPSLAAALAEYVVVAGKSGFGRMVSGGRRRQAAANLAAAADAFVSSIEHSWTEQGEQLLQATVLTAVAHAQANAAVVAATEDAARAAAVEASWRERVETAVATGTTWQGVDASRVVRSWGAGAAAARRYVIGSGEVLNTVIDLTDGTEPCLRVITPTMDTPSVTVLTAQYGLPLSALS